jgi:hypothetical protein
MAFATDDLHDASLSAIRFDWRARTCTLEFAGSPSSQTPFSLSFEEVTELVVPCGLAWGPSVSVLSAQQLQGRFELHMQSGDIISVVSSNNRSSGRRVDVS